VNTGRVFDCLNVTERSTIFVVNCSTEDDAVVLVSISILMALTNRPQNIGSKTRRAFSGVVGRKAAINWRGGLLLLLSR
jgi:hypothetical protein